MRLRAKTGLLYPAPTCLAMVLSAGGLSQLTAEQRATLQLRRVEAGDWCDDLPAVSRAAKLACGDVEEVEGALPGVAKAVKKAKGKVR